MLLFNGVNTPSKTLKLHRAVLILAGGVEAFVIPYPVLITEVTRPRRSDGCWFRRSLA